MYVMLFNVFVYLHAYVCVHACHACGVSIRACNAVYASMYGCMDGCMVFV